MEYPEEKCLCMKPFGPTKGFLSIALYRLWHTKAHTIPLYTKQYIVYQPHIVNVKRSLNNKSSLRPVSVCLILHCLEK